MIQYEIKITGHVQGVGFRYFVHQKANEIGIKGWVKNTIDRGVLVMAQGNETNLTTFIDYLMIGPALSRVNKVYKYKMKIVNEFSDFQIKS